MIELVDKKTKIELKNINGVIELDTPPVIQIDKTLTQEGMAADAKATGDAIANIPAPPQPDWNQQDETKPDYIKNRIAYSTGKGEDVAIIKLDKSELIPSNDWAYIWMLECSPTPPPSHKTLQMALQYNDQQEREVVELTEASGWYEGYNKRGDWILFSLTYEDLDSGTQYPGKSGISLCIYESNWSQVPIYIERVGIRWKNKEPIYNTEIVHKLSNSLINTTSNLIESSNAPLNSSAVLPLQNKVKDIVNNKEVLKDENGGFCAGAGSQLIGPTGGLNERQGGAIGYLAKSNNGFSGGDGAASNHNSVAIGARATVNYNLQEAIQLGEGTNNTEGTLQFKSYPLVNADGMIPPERVMYPAYNWNAKEGERGHILNRPCYIEQEGQVVPILTRNREDFQKIYDNTYRTVIPCKTLAIETAKELTIAIMNTQGREEITTVTAASLYDYTYFMTSGAGVSIAIYVAVMDDDYAKIADGITIEIYNEIDNFKSCRFNIPDMKPMVDTSVMKMLDNKMIKARSKCKMDDYTPVNSMAVLDYGQRTIYPRLQVLSQEVSKIKPIVILDTTITAAQAGANVLELEIKNQEALSQAKEIFLYIEQQVTENTPKKTWYSAIIQDPEHLAIDFPLSSGQPLYDAVAGDKVIVTSHCFIGQNNRAIAYYGIPSKHQSHNTNYYLYSMMSRFDRASIHDWKGLQLHVNGGSSKFGEGSKVYMEVYI